MSRAAVESAVSNKDVHVTNMLRRQKALILCAGTMFSAAESWGDQASTLERGARVRVVLTEEARRSGLGAATQLSGTLLNLNDSLLTLETPATRDSAVVSRQDVELLEMRISRDKRGIGALVGFGVGIAAGVLLGQASGDDEGSFAFFSRDDKKYLYSFLLAPVGAFIGVRVAPREKWEPVHLDRVRVSFEPSVRRPGFAVAVRF